MSAVANAEQWRLLISGSDGRAWWDAADCADKAEDHAAAVRPSHYKNATIDRKVSGNSSFCLLHRFFPTANVISVIFFLDDNEVVSSGHKTHLSSLDVKSNS